MSRATSCGMGLQKCSEAVENQSKHTVLTHLFTFGAFQSTNTICSLARDKTRCYKGTGKLKSEESLIMVIFACSDVDNGISANYGVPKHISNQISATDVWLLGHQRIPYSHKRLLTWFSRWGWWSLPIPCAGLRFPSIKLTSKNIFSKKTFPQMPCQHTEFAWVFTEKTVLELCTDTWEVNPF